MGKLLDAHWHDFEGRRDGEMETAPSRCCLDSRILQPQGDRIAEAHGGVVKLRGYAEFSAQEAFSGRHRDFKL